MGGRSMKVIRKAVVNVGRGGDIVDEEIKEKRAKDAALRDAHLHLSPSGHLTPVDNSYLLIS